MNTMPPVRIELTTSSLLSWRSTTKLKRLSYNYNGFSLYSFFRKYIIFYVFYIFVKSGDLFSLVMEEIFRKIHQKIKKLFQKFFQVFKNGHLFVHFFVRGVFNGKKIFFLRPYHYALDVFFKKKKLLLNFFAFKIWSFFLFPI